MFSVRNRSFVGRALALLAILLVVFAPLAPLAPAGVASAQESAPEAVKPSAPAPAAEPSVAPEDLVDDAIEEEDPDEKRDDLARARQHGGRSPDRLVVVYDSASALDHPDRARVRQATGGRLLRASRVLRRDVIRVPSGDATAAAQRVLRLPGVVDAYPDVVARASLSVNDPELSQQWALSKIGAPAAWDTTQGSGVSVAVLDCGVHSTHPDLAGQVALERNFTATTTTDDLCGHGTHVAGTIAAATNNSAGVASVAGAARLINAKVLDDTGNGYFSDVETAIQWAAENGAKVINLSLGADSPCLTATQNAVDYAWSRGALVVAAAGNAGQNRVDTPANCRNAIAVGATDSADARASFSSYGSGVQLAAPGVSVYSTINPDLPASGGAHYGVDSGTSMAAPHVSGVAALLWATSHGAGATAVRDRLFNTASQVSGTGSLWTYGRVDAARAVSTAAPSNDPFAAGLTLSAAGSVTGSTALAATESGEPSPSCATTGKTLWYRVSPNASGTLTLSTTGSGYDTLLAVYTGLSLSNLKQAACNDDVDGTLQSRLAITVTAGQTYHVQLGGYRGASGSFLLQASLAASATATSTPAPTATATPLPTSTPTVTPAAATATNTPAPTATSGSSTTYSQAVLADSPAAYWRLGELSGTTAADSTGRGYTGTLSGGVTLGSAGALAGDTNTAFTLDGATGSVATTLGQSSVSQYTVEAWVKTTSTGLVPVVEARGAEFSGGQSLTLTVGYNGGQGSNPGTVNFGLDSDGLWIGGHTSVTVNDGRWHHVAGVFSGASGASVSTGQFVVYVDGQIAPLTTAVFGSAAAPLSGSGGTVIGRHRAWNGWAGAALDEVAVYPAALSGTRIAEHYRLGSGGAAATPLPTATPSRTPTPAGTPRPPGVEGLQGGRPIDDAGSLAFPHALMDQLPIIQEAGAGWVRVNFRLGGAYNNWTDVGANGTTALAQYDRVIDDARARGLRVLGLLSNESWHGGQDQWTAGNAEHGLGSGDNAYMRAFSQNAAVVLTRHFRGKIDVWEVWNEPNAWTSNPAPGVYDGATFIYPSNFAWLLRHVYADTRAAGLSGLTFVTGGLFGHDIGGVTLSVRGQQVVKRGEYYGPRPSGASAPSASSHVPSGADHLTATYQQGQVNAGWETLRQQYGSYPLDAIGQHVYFVHEPLVTAAKVRAYLDDVRSAYVGYEGTSTGKQIVVTEFGWQSPGVTQQEQAENLRTSYGVFKETAYVTNAYWFSVQDVPEASLYYGLQTGGDATDGYRGTRKLAFEAYQSLAAVPPATATPTRTPTVTATGTATATPTAALTATSTATATTAATRTPTATGTGTATAAASPSPTPAALAAAYASTPPLAWSPGQTQSYAITLTNTGSQTWNAAGTNQVRLGVHFGTASDAPHDGWATDQRFALPYDISPGASVTITVGVTAPTTAGGYVLRHRMVKEYVAWFDQVHKTSVTVGSTAATATATPSATPSPVASATPAQTAVASATPVPTFTPTPGATATIPAATNTPTPAPTATLTPTQTATATAAATLPATHTPAPAATPPNDAFGAAETIGTSASVGGSTVGATREAGEPRPCSDIGSTIWYRVVPGASGTLTVSTEGSGYDTVLAIYRGTSLSGLSQLDCKNDYRGSQQARVSVSVTAGQTYYVQLGGYRGAAGSFSLSTSLR